MRDSLFNASFERRAPLLHSQVTTAFRCIQRGEIAAVDCAVDFYGGFLCVWLYEENTPLPRALEKLTPYLDRLSTYYQASGGVLKRVNRNPHAKTLVDTQIGFGDPIPESIVVEEHSLKFLTTLTGGQHTGLFLDQRDNRRRVYEMSENKRVANLFAYTCSFSVAAAAGGAEVVFSIDSARPCLETGKRNFDLNHLTESRRGKFIQEDVRVWLEKQVRTHAQFDLIICDPPTFSSTKSAGIFSVDAEWETLASSCSRLLSKNGIAFFSTNHRDRDRHHYLRGLRATFNTVEQLTPPLDFPALPGHPEPVKLFLCKK